MSLKTVLGFVDVFLLMLLRTALDWIHAVVEMLKMD